MRIDLMKKDIVIRDIKLSEITKEDINIKDNNWIVIYGNDNGIVRCFYQENFNFVYEYSSINAFYRKELPTLQELIKLIEFLNTGEN